VEKSRADGPGLSKVGADLWVAEAGADRDQDVLAIEIAGTVLSLAEIRMRLTPSHPLHVSLRGGDLAKCWN
jgi:hypothetical protein